MGLSTLDLKPVLATSTDELLKVFYIPALSQSVAYDRGVGYFTSAWLRMVATGLVRLAANGGKVRLVASPILQEADWAALKRGVEARSDPRLYTTLRRTLDELGKNLTEDTMSAIAWMIADGLLDFRLAIPTDALDGDFHDKFGLFRDVAGNEVAFHGSQNDSAKAFRNYESIDVFCSWMDSREAQRVALHRERFERIWSNSEPNLVVFDLPESIQRDLVQLTNHTRRPYNLPDTLAPKAERKWRHQAEAVEAFLKKEHGILAMATGTGKTRTAITLLEHLEKNQKICTTVVTAYGTDLLDQWYKQLSTKPSRPVYRHYDIYKELLTFLNDPEEALLLVSRQSLVEVLPRLQARLKARGFLICDEVHGMGSASLVSGLRGQLKPFRYRLGLSATPEREYDDVGNAFIEEEIGPIIYRFELEHAIQRGILCEFDYIPLGYAYSDEDRESVRRLIARHHALAAQGKAPPIEDLYRDLGRVRKLCQNKIPVFQTYVSRRPELLHRSIIFVETSEYGEQVQDILIKLLGNFHTYYGEDERTNLVRFARGELDCLLTCRRISEGIDIQSVNNIILFSSARGKLETIQRLGSCLRLDPTNPQKRPIVLDFVRTDESSPEESGIPPADEERRQWLNNLSHTRRTES